MVWWILKQLGFRLKFHIQQYNLSDVSIQCGPLSGLTKSVTGHCTAIKVFGITLFPHILPRRKDLFDLCPYCKLSRAGQWKGLGTKLVVQYTCFILDTNSPQMLLVLLNCTVTRSKLASLLLKLMFLPIKHLN